MLTPFHLAIPVKNIESARHFYGQVLGCSEGRSSDTWVDFNFFGHQLVCHVDPNLNNTQHLINQVDGKQVPVPHFGVVLEIKDWQILADSLKQAKITFIIEPHIRFEGLPGEQATMFFLDPDGYALEFKAFHNIKEDLFKK